MIDAVLDPWPPFTFCCPQAIVDQDAGVSIPNSSPFPRSTRLPFTSTASPPAPLAIRKAPSASVESIEPRPPRPCEVGRPKGRRRKNRRQSHKFFFSTCCAPRLPRPCEVGRPKGRRRKNRRNLTIFLSTCRAIRPRAGYYLAQLLHFANIDGMEFIGAGAADLLEIGLLPSRGIERVQVVHNHEL